MSEIRRALIVGGGPAGMTAALALAQASVECSIVELQRDWRPAAPGAAAGPAQPRRAEAHRPALAMLAEPI